MKSSHFKLLRPIEQPLSSVKKTVAEGTVSGIDQL